MNKIQQINAEALRFMCVIFNNYKIFNNQDIKNLTKFKSSFKEKNDLSKSIPYIHKLSEAQDFLSKIKGFQHYHEVQKVLETKKIEPSFSDEIKDILLSSFSNHIKTVNCNQKEYILQKQSHPTNNFIFGKTRTSSLLNLSKDVYYQPTNNHLFIGDRGTGLPEYLYNKVINEFENNQPFIFFDGTGTAIFFNYLTHYAQENNNVESFYYFNLVKRLEQNDYITNSINPIDIWSIDQQCLTSTVGETVSKLLFPALQFFRNKSLKISLQSLLPYISLGHILEMAIANLYENKDASITYLQSLCNSEHEKNLFNNILANKNEADINTFLQSKIKQHLLNCEQAIEVFHSISNFISSGHFSDNATIDIFDIFTKRKKLFCMFPSFTDIPKPYTFIYSILNNMVISVEKIYSEQHLQNIYYLYVPFSLDEQSKKSKNSFTFASYNLNIFTEQNLKTFDYIYITKVSFLPNEIENFFINTYYSTAFYEGLDVLKETSKINIYNSNEKRNIKKNLEIIGIIRFHTSAQNNILWLSQKSYGFKYYKQPTSISTHQGGLK